MLIFPTTNIFIYIILGTNTTIGGVNGLLEDILSLLPQDEIFVLFFEKLEKSPQFNTLVAAIGNPDFARKYNILWVKSLCMVYLYSILYIIILLLFTEFKRISFSLEPT